MNEKYLNSDEIKRELVNILKKTMIFLEKNSINYYICAGTFLGAVRHKGFIPWDDDIDLFITRDDYEKLIKIAKFDNCICENLEIVSYELQNDIHPFIKILNKDVSICEEDEIDNYLWIDIFPLDGVPNNEDKINSYLRKCFIKNQIYCLKCLKVKSILNSNKSTVKKISKIFIKALLVFINKKRYMNKFLKMIKKYTIRDSKNVANCVWVGHYRGYMSKKIIDDISYYDFEDLKVKSFKDYDLYLKSVYGDDYMELPPKEKRITHNYKAWYNN